MNPRLLATRPTPSLKLSSALSASARLRRPAIVTRSYSQSLQYPSLTARSIHLPRILDPNLYRAIIPKAWRTEGSAVERLRPTRNPALFYVIIFMLIGSQAIHMLVLKKERENFERTSEARIRVLKDVIGRLQKGEEVDVRKLLGTGDEQQEKSWEDVVREIEEEEEMWRRREKRKAAAASSTQDAQSTREKPAQDAAPAKSGDGQSRKPMFF